MAVNSVVSVGLQGIHKGMHGLNQNAHRIANIGTEEGPQDLGGVAAEMVSLKENQLQVEASVKVLQVNNEVLGTLINIHA